jgi:hypothetical protein
MGNCIDSMRFYLLDPTDISIHDLTQQHQSLQAQREQLEEAIARSGVQTAWDEARLYEIDTRLSLAQMALDKSVTRQAERNTSVLTRTTRRIQDSDTGVGVAEDDVDTERIANEIRATRKLTTARLSAFVRRPQQEAKETRGAEYASLTNVVEEDEEDDGLGGSVRLRPLAEPL